ncbi:MAG: hypothetical protein Tsb0034_28330 [Ekhidna sp.]
MRGKLRKRNAIMIGIDFRNDLSEKDDQHGDDGCKQYNGGSLLAGLPNNTPGDIGGYGHNEDIDQVVEDQDGCQ